jgi:hypothetical protein
LGGPNIGFQTARHDDEFACTGADDTAGNRSIDPRHARLAPQPLGHLSTSSGFDSRTIDQDFLIRRSSGNAVGAKDDLVHSAIVSHAGEDNVRRPRNISWRFGRSRPSRNRTGHFLRSSVPDRYGMTGCQEAFKHWKAHQPQTNESQGRLVVGHILSSGGKPSMLRPRASLSLYVSST